MILLNNQTYKGNNQTKFNDFIKYKILKAKIKINVVIILYE